MRVITAGEKKGSKVLQRETWMAVGGNVAALRQPETTAQSDSDERFNAKRRIDDAMTPELVIALCGPLGTPLHRVSQTLKELLEKSYDYKLVEEIRLSRFIKDNAQPKDPNSILELIEAGNALRKAYGNSVLAQLAIRKIATVRQQQREDFDDAQLRLAGVEPAVDAVIPSPVVRHCHIIDSAVSTLKRNTSTQVRCRDGNTRDVSSTEPR